MIQQAWRKNEAIGGETVQPDETIGMAPFLSECEPNDPSSIPMDQKNSKLSWVILLKFLIKRSYWWVPGNNLEFF